jgi:hypothetical protein
MRSSNIRWGATVCRHSPAVIAVGLIFISGIAASGANAAKRPTQPKLVVLIKPAAATVGERITISGRVKGKVGGENFRVGLQTGKWRPRTRKKGTAGAGIRFSTQTAADVSNKQRFSIKYLVPKKPGVVFLRLRLLQGKRVVSKAKAWKLIVRAAVPVGPVQDRKTLVLNSGAVLEVPAPGQAGQTRLSGYVDLNPGDIVAVGVGPATPYGFLGKVVSVSHDASGTILQTVPATLPEAVPEGSWSGKIDPEPIDSEDTTSGSSAQLQAIGAIASGVPGSTSSNVRVQSVLKCGFDSELIVDGTIHVDSWIDTSASWSFSSGVKAKFVGHMNAEGKLTLTAEANASCGTGTKTLFLVPLGAVVFSVGPVPVVLVPVVSATLSAGGGLSGTVTTSASGTAEVHAGVDFYDGQPHPVGSISPKFTGGDPPSAEGSGHIGATISPAINVLVYGVAGPKAAVNVGLSLDASAGGSPTWRLTAPVSVTAGLSIPALNISSPEFTIWQEDYLLGEG